MGRCLVGECVPTFSLRVGGFRIRQQDNHHGLVDIHFSELMIVLCVT